MSLSLFEKLSQASLKSVGHGTEWRHRHVDPRRILLTFATDKWSVLSPQNRISSRNIHCTTLHLSKLTGAVWRCGAGIHTWLALRVFVCRTFKRTNRWKHSPPPPTLSVSLSAQRTEGNIPPAFLTSLVGSQLCGWSVDGLGGKVIPAL
jgi:hypothetical protein